MERYLKISAVVLLCFFAFSCVNTGEPQAQEPNLAADFTLQDINQIQYSLNSYRDRKHVLLFFWTTWCPFCRKEINVLNQKYAQLTGEEVEVLTINVGEAAYKVSRFLKNYNLPFAVLLDSDTSVAGAYNIMGIPSYVLIAKDGKVVYRGNYFPESKYKQIISE